MMVPMRCRFYFLFYLLSLIIQSCKFYRLNMSEAGRRLQMMKELNELHAALIKIKTRCISVRKYGVIARLL